MDGSRWSYIKVNRSLVEAGRSFHRAWPCRLPLCFHFGKIIWLALASKGETSMQQVHRTLHLLSLHSLLLEFDYQKFHLTSLRLPNFLFNLRNFRFDFQTSILEAEWKLMTSTGSRMEVLESQKWKV